MPKEKEKKDARFANEFVLCETLELIRYRDGGRESVIDSM